MCHLELDESVPFEPFPSEQGAWQPSVSRSIGRRRVTRSGLGYCISRSGDLRTCSGRRSRSTKQHVRKSRIKEPCVPFWFTSLAGAGKSTVANLIERSFSRGWLPHLPARRRQREARICAGAIMRYVGHLSASVVLANQVFCPPDMRAFRLIRRFDSSRLVSVHGARLFDALRHKNISLQGLLQGFPHNGNVG